MTGSLTIQPEPFDRVAAARIWVMRTGNASIASLARELGISWRSAEQLMLALEAEGIVTAPGLFRAQRRLTPQVDQTEGGASPARSLHAPVRRETR